MLTVSQELSQSRVTRSLWRSTSTLRSLQKELLQKPRLTPQRTEAVFFQKVSVCLTSIWLGSFNMPRGLKPAMRNDQGSQSHSSISPSAESCRQHGQGGNAPLGAALWQADGLSQGAAASKIKMP